MRYASQYENGVIFVKFTAGDSVTISVTNSSGASESLTSASAIQIGSTNYFYWKIDNIISASSTHEDYLVIADNGAYTQSTQVGIGGFPDEIYSTSGRGTTADTAYLTLTGYVEPDFTMANLSFSGLVRASNSYLGITFQVGQEHPTMALISLTGVVYDDTYDAYDVEKIKLVSLRI